MTVTANNVSEVYLWNADVNSVTAHIDGRAYSLDADLLKTLTHYTSKAPAETRLIQIYAAGVLEQFSGDTVQFVIDSNAAQGHFIEIGSNPQPLAIQRSAAQVITKRAVKIAKIRRENPKAGAVLATSGMAETADLTAQVKMPKVSKPVAF